jgi:hypothetical protein
MIALKKAQMRERDIYPFFLLAAAFASGLITSYLQLPSLKKKPHEHDMGWLISS